MRLSHIKHRLEQQLELSEIIAKSWDNHVKGGLARVTTQRVQIRLEALKENWEKFSVFHDSIGVALQSLDAADRECIRAHSYFSENIFALTQECFLETIEKFTSFQENDSIIRASASSAPPASSESSEIQSCYYRARLPRIDLPKFNGSPSDWLSFKDLFRSLVLENPTLTAVEKLQYLKTSLTGSASQLLKNTTLTSDNFQKSWDALLSFYENKRLLVNAALQSLLSLKHMTKESASEIETLYTTIMQIYRTLETLQRPVSTWDDFFVFIAVQRLDSDSVKAWEHHLGSTKEPPSWTQFSEFLTTRMLSLQAFEKSRPGKFGSQAHSKPVKAHFQSQVKDDSAVSRSCVFCSAQHALFLCPKYIAKPVPERVEILSKHKLCYNCLGHHRVSACRSTRRCSKCGRKHHTTIHKKFQVFSAKPESTPAQTKAVKSDSTPKDAQVLHSRSQTPAARHNVLLATAKVIAVSPTGETAKIRLLIDQGSEITLISERAAQRLHLHRTHSSIPIIGIGVQGCNRTKGAVTVELRSCYDSDSNCVVQAHILSRLTSLIPAVNINQCSWPHLTGLNLADPDFTSSAPIDLILGADFFGQIIANGLIKDHEEAPIAQNTTFGWIVSGPVNSSASVDNVNNFHVAFDRELHDLLSKFWELETISSSPNTTLSPHDRECESHFVATHSRESSGRYVVRLPFKDSPTLLGNSKNKALQVVRRLASRFEKDPAASHDYHKFMREYENLNHMTLVSPAQAEPASAFYLPHHGVWKINDSNAKLRVVFNGSSPTDTGVSLNELLHTGARLQANLFDVLVWFRQFRYVFSSDIEKMYRQIKVHPDDWRFQRILWLDNDHHIQIYELTTVTYGLSCAPFLALRTVQQLITDEGQNFPVAVPTLKKGRYVDDLFGGADSIEQAQQIVLHLNQICTAGGFPLRKWIANDSKILSSVPESHYLNSVSRPLEDTPSVTTLGLGWQPAKDVLHFTFKAPSLKIITKRSVLSTIAKVFDPLGLLSPVTITAKIFLQELWLIKLGWDDPLPADLSDRWRGFVSHLSEIPDLCFPRWIGFSQEDTIEIHGFCDASQSAFSAVVYIRTIKPDKTFSIHLVASKTKVAPLKRLTIPRLELSGAVLLAKLIHTVIQTLDLPSAPVYLWTDSSIVLTWLTSHPSKWKDFVHHRVCLIQETVPHASWKFVSGIQNPADLATRGLTPTQLCERSDWWTGPSWLAKDRFQWPCNSPHDPPSDQLEERPIRSCSATVRTPEQWNLITKYSDLLKLFRITALCLRFISRLKKGLPPSVVNLISPHELDTARNYWVKTTQQTYFHAVIEILSRGQPLSKSNSLIKLSPFLDSEGLLRVGGRLRESHLSFGEKHPLILPKVSPLTLLVINHAHFKTLHGGTQVTLTFIRRNYWILGGRVPVRSFIQKCIRCVRYRQQRAQQLMGQLPKSRVTPSRPFLNTGLDYAGPFTVKTWKGKNAKTYKAYLVLFVCLSTSAIHLEIVTDYSTDAFLAAYHRFTARRGICSTLWSDCGTNLVGADARLKVLFSESSKEVGQLAALLANDGTEWKFNPPGAPHFGGKWEAGVKSVKFHLKRVIGDTLLTYEELSTLTTQIEAVLNSRPLSPLSDDPDDFSVLTPGHFLIGCAPTTIPEPSLEDIKSSRLARWQMIRQMMSSFWSRWSNECLQRYQAINKWNQIYPSLKTGDLVLVVDERYPPSKWPMGRVTAVHPGKDGHVRVVTVRTQTTTLTRPIAKICPLPISNDTV